MGKLAAILGLFALTLPVGAEEIWVTPAGKAVTACYAWAGGTGTPKLCFARPLTRDAADLAACAAQGGTPRTSDSMKPTFVCGFPPLDAGKACRTSEDCTLACDALTHECRAFSVMGQVLDKQGNRVQVVN